MARKKAQSEAKQVGKFGAVGIINTVIDFSFFNLFTQVLRLAVIPSNYGSTAIAMAFSFYANKTFVFSNQDRGNLRQILSFVLVTAVGTWVIQPSIIYFLLNIWTWPLDFGYGIVQLINLDGLFARKFVFDNGAKAFGIAVAMVWNYLAYKKIVFKHV